MAVKYSTPSVPAEKKLYRNWWDGGSIIYLPDELLMEVFKRLSVKSLGQMRCVQKSWYNLIRTPYFISLHLDHQQHKDEYLLFSSPSKKRYSLRFDDKQCKEYCALRFPDGIVKKLNSSIKLYGTSRGLICFSSVRVKVIYVCNPVIGKFIALPDSPLGYYELVGLAFGYSAKSNDYKVIKIAKDYFRKNPRSRFIYVCVYSLRTNSWKTVKEHNFASLLFLQICNSVVVNGAAYWIGRKDDDQREDLIVSFDMEDETFREIMMPQNRPSYSICFLQNFGVELSLFYCCKQSGTIYTWVLENEGEINEAWAEMVTIYPNESVGRRWCPVGFRSNGDIVLTKTFKCGYMSYDLNLEEATEFVEDPEDIWFFENSFEFTYLHEDEMLSEPFDPMYVCPFEENLVLLDDFR